MGEPSGLVSSASSRFRAAAKAAPKVGLITLVKTYRVLLSPWLGSSCRFFPTCSGYALEALETHGAAAGTYLTLRRLARCHPWCEAGEDPVPQAVPRLFSALMSDRRWSPISHTKISHTKELP